MDFLKIFKNKNSQEPDLPPMPEEFSIKSKMNTISNLPSFDTNSPPMPDLLPMPDMQANEPSSPFPDLPPMPSPEELTPRFTPSEPVNTQEIPQPLNLDTSFQEPQKNQVSTPRVDSSFQFPELDAGISSMKSEFNIPAPKLNPIEEHEVFVSMDNYKQILDDISTIKSDIKRSDDIFTRLNEIKNIKNEKFEKWKDKLEDIQRKLVYIEKTLYEDD